ncbi:hypothetical protein MP638_006651 [Amoeboaphelidium occidentale]|nr:hypothetical protein MP638_006651 [Amoeboaphelidium occidentale]
MSATTPIEAKHYKEFLFTALECGDKWKCTLCSGVIKVKKNSGCTNFKNHIMGKGTGHEQADEIIRCRQVSGKDASFKQLGIKIKVDGYSIKIFRWIEWVVLELHPFSMVEKPYTRKNSNLPIIAKNTLKNTSDDLPDIFGVITDGWSESGTHFVAIYATYEGVNEKVTQVLLSCGPMGDETSLSSAVFVEHLQNTLELYGKSISCVKYMVLDNASVNVASARALGIHFIGCLSHRLALSVKHFLNACDKELKVQLQNIQSIMLKLSNLKLKAQLRKYSCLQPVLLSDTRWNGLYRMLHRFLDKEFLAAVNTISNTRDCFENSRARLHFEELLPDDAVLDVLAIFLNQLEIINQTSEYLQLEDLTLLDAHRAINMLVESLNDDMWEQSIYAYCDHSYSDASNTSEFTRAVCLLLEDPSNVTQLTESQIMALAPFKKSAEIIRIENEEVSPVKENDSIRAMTSFCNNMLFHGLRAIVPTSNVCERLFSKAGLVFREQRKSLLPRTVEMLLFLNVNHKYWDEGTVDLAIKKSQRKDPVVLD